MHTNSWYGSATQIQNGSSVRSAESASETVIFSGGGFSNVFGMPSYQKVALASYFTNHKPNYTAAQYNDSMTTRGFPYVAFSYISHCYSFPTTKDHCQWITNFVSDISANGANYLVAIDGEFTLIYGTSASCPTVAALITVINERRIATGKTSVGFLNPVLYQSPEMLNDIVKGGNEGCGTAGFTAVEGMSCFFFSFLFRFAEIFARAKFLCAVFFRLHLLFWARCLIFRATSFRAIRDSCRGVGAAAADSVNQVGIRWQAWVLYELLTNQP